MGVKERYKGPDMDVKGFFWGCGGPEIGVRRFCCKYEGHRSLGMGSNGYEGLWVG